jgi:hypothetical protein
MINFKMYTFLKIKKKIFCYFLKEYEKKIQEVSNNKILFDFLSDLSYNKYQIKNWLENPDKKITCLYIILHFININIELIITNLFVSILNFLI